MGGVICRAPRERVSTCRMTPGQATLIDWFCLSSVPVEKHATRTRTPSHAVGDGGRGAQYGRGELISNGLRAHNRAQHRGACAYADEPWATLRGVREIRECSSLFICLWLIADVPAVSSGLRESACTSSPAVGCLRDGTSHTVPSVVVGPSQARHVKR
jgi:hypothetical protein